MSARLEKLGSFALVLRWNPAVLQFNSGQAGTFGDASSNEDSVNAGVLKLTGVNPAGATGHLTVGIGSMTPLAADTTTIKVQVVELYAAQTFTDLTPSVAATDRPYCSAR